MKIYLSSAENDKNQKVLLSVKEPKRVLVSYYYLRNKSDEKVHDVLSAYIEEGSEIMLDSGAHSFLNELDSIGGKGRKGMSQRKMSRTDVTPEEYIEGYFEFVAKFSNYFASIVELDIDAIVGYKKVCEWWDRFMALGLKDKMVRVFHKSIPDSINEWERWCKEGYLLGIGGFPSIRVHNVLFTIALQYKAKVHGFAMTKTQFMLKYPWYSVDSSSWNTGQRFGILMYYNGRMGISTCHLRKCLQETKGITMFMNRIFPTIHKYLGDISLKNIATIKSNSAALDRISIAAFLELERKLTEIWKLRGVVY